MSPPPLQFGHKVGSHKGYVLCVSSWLAPTFGLKIGGNFSEDLFFFCSSPNFGRKIGLNMSEDLFFCCSSPNFGPKIGLILGGTISDSDLCSSQIFVATPPFQNPAYATALVRFKLLYSHSCVVTPALTIHAINSHCHADAFPNVL